MSADRMNASDPEPNIGAVVRDAFGIEWEHVEATHGGSYWLSVDAPDSDPESWIKVAGNYGPVVLMPVEETP